MAPKTVRVPGQTDHLRRSSLIGRVAPRAPRALLVCVGGAYRGAEQAEMQGVAPACMDIGIVLLRAATRPWGWVSSGLWPPTA